MGFGSFSCQKIRLISASLAIDLFELKDQEFLRMKFGAMVIQHSLLGLDCLLLPLSTSVGQQRAKVQGKGLTPFQASQLHMQMVGACGAASAHTTDAATGLH